MGLLMSGIYGPPGSISSNSASLSSSLENRFRVRTAGLGSTLLRLTWKEKVTPSGRRISQAQALAPRTSGSATTSSLTGWPTTTTNDAKGSDYTYNSGNHNSICLKLGGAAKLAGWATAAAAEAGGTPEQFLARKEKAVANGKQLGVSLTSLSLQAQMAGWPTTTRDHKDGASVGTAPVNALLGRQVWAVTGVRWTGCSVTTEEVPSGAQLNPAHSRWIQGLPPVWDACAPMATPSKRRSRRSSSRAIAKLDADAG